MTCQIYSYTLWATLEIRTPAIREESNVAKRDRVVSFC